MPDRTFEILASLYGGEFARAYEQKRRNALKAISDEELKKIKEFADKEMRKHPLDLHVKYNNYDIILVESPSRPDLRELRVTRSGNYKAIAVWNGAPTESNFVSVFGSEDVLQPLTRPGVFYLVGRLQQREYNGKITYAFNAVAVIDLAEGLDVPAEEVEGKPTVKETTEEEELDVVEFFP